MTALDFKSIMFEDEHREAVAEVEATFLASWMVDAALAHSGVARWQLQGSFLPVASSSGSFLVPDWGCLLALIFVSPGGISRSGGKP